MQTFIIPTETWTFALLVEEEELHPIRIFLRSTDIEFEVRA